WEVNLFYLNRSKSTKVKLTLNPNEMWRPSGFKLSLWVPWLQLRTKWRLNQNNRWNPSMMLS
ncbi:MAG: hypothetical protein ACTS4Y_00775, partial [Candidatus Hodgkinia cicadicola]